MTSTTIQDGLNWHAKCFLSGKFGGIMRRYKETLPVYLDGEVLLMEGHDELREQLAIHRDEILSAGVVDFAGRYKGGQRVEHGRYRFQADWLYFTNDGRPPRISSAVYYCQRQPSGTVFEMIEYKKLAFADAPKWHQTSMPIVQVSDYAVPGYVH